MQTSSVFIQTSDCSPINVYGESARLMLKTLLTKPYYTIFVTRVKFREHLALRGAETMVLGSSPEPRARDAYITLESHENRRVVPSNSGTERSNLYVRRSQTSEFMMTSFPNGWKHPPVSYLRQRDRIWWFVDSHTKNTYHFISIPVNHRKHWKLWSLRVRLKHHDSNVQSAQSFRKAS